MLGAAAMAGSNDWERDMYKRILLAYDGSDAGQKALLECKDLAQWSQSEVALVAVMPSAMSFVGLEGGVYDVELEEREKKKYQAVLEDGIRRLSEAGWTARGEVVTGEAVDEINKAALKVGADLIVVGHKHLDSWAARWWRGSISGALIEHAPCSVLVVITN
jgi:nucleotide-binding universal stress UspA family protein